MTVQPEPEAPRHTPLRPPTPAPMKNAMRTRLLRSALLLALLGTTGCAIPELQHEPWSQTGKGTHQVGASTGWAFYGAEVHAKGKNGVLKPGGVAEVGSDDTDLTPQYGGALKYSYFFTDHISVGGILELRSFEPDPVSPLSATLSTDDFQTTHLLLSGRYWFDPWERNPRFKPFVGVDLGYVPKVEFGDVTVAYPTSTGIPNEMINVEGSSFWTLGAVAGASYLYKDNMTLDFGAFYEWTLNASKDTLTFSNLGNSQADVRVDPEGLIFFFGVSFLF